MDLPTAVVPNEAGLDALLFDLRVLSALLFDPPSVPVDREQAA